MNILMISDVYFPRINGVSTSIQTFRETLGAEGVQVTLVAPEYPGASGDPDDDEVIAIPSRRVPFDPEDRLMRRGDLARLSQRLQGRHFDLVHVQTPFVAHYAGLKLARARGIPCLATYHTHFEEYFHHYLPILPRPFARLLTRRLARSQCNALDAVVVPSQAMRNALQDYGVTKPLHVLPTGIPLEKFTRGDRQGFRQRYGIADGEAVALYVGRVALEKNLGFLLEATRHALARHPALRLVIAGEGPALAGLKRQAAALGIEKKVLFAGYLDREQELPDCYAAADLFTFPSKTETQGLVLLEAMAMGLPTLGIPAMGAAEILGPQRGAVCAPDNAADFGALIADLLGDSKRLRGLSTDARNFACEWAAPERASQLATLYRTLRRLASPPRVIRPSTPIQSA
ncbi:MAG: glycosyltransferase [Betaproteobacteria bacterium]|nr:glycosyltransferase [Betaproteobacteria bacterium]